MRSISENTPHFDCFLRDETIWMNIFQTVNGLLRFWCGDFGVILIMNSKWPPDLCMTHAKVSLKSYRIRFHVENRLFIFIDSLRIRCDVDIRNFQFPLNFIW